MFKLSLNLVIEALTSLGLTRRDAKVYVYIAKKGSHKAVALSRELSYSKQKIYDSLKILQSKGLVSKSDSEFFAIPFEEALELLINWKKKETNNFQNSEREILSNWKNEE